VAAVIDAALFLDGFLYGLAVPLAPFAGADRPGLLPAGYAAGLLGATPFCGHLGGRLGCRRLMLLGSACAAAAIALLGAGGSSGTALAARVLQGMAASASWTGGLALLARDEPGGRVRRLGLAMAASTAGSVLGPAAGGWLHLAGGPAIPALVAGALAVLVGWLQYRVLPRLGGSRPAPRAAATLLLDPRVILAILGVALAAAAWGIVEPILPVHLDHTIQASPALIGVVFTLAALVYGLVAPGVDWIAGRFSLGRTMGLGLAGLAMALPLLAWAAGTAQTSAALCLVSVAFAFALNPASAALSDAADRRGQGGCTWIFAVYNAAYALGMIGGGAVAARHPELCSLSGHCSAGPDCSGLRAPPVDPGAGAGRALPSWSWHPCACGTPASPRAGGSWRT
jgi:MFS family permease